MLKSFPRPVAQLTTGTTFRDYVDDMTLMAVAATATHAAASLQEDLVTIKAALRNDNMKLNAAKEQVFGLTKGERQAWQSLTEQEAVAVAKDLGVYHYGYDQAHPVMDKKLQDLRGPCIRIGMVPASRDRKLHMSAALLFGKCLYGEETHFLTQKQFCTMRTLLSLSMGKGLEHRSPGPVLLLVQGGKFEPEVAKMCRLTRHWEQEHQVCEIP
jgi:hypothetical protein